MIHPLADVKSDQIGEGTTVWQFCVILKGAVIGCDCNVNAHCLIESCATIGDRVTLKSGVYVWDGITLGDDVFVGPNVTFTNDLRPRSKRRPPSWTPTIVKRGASIGAGAVLIGGVVVGEYALIGAGTVVTRDVPAHALVYGNPGELRGWVCRCGSRLQEGTSCDECGVRYEDVAR